MHFIKNYNMFIQRIKDIKKKKIMIYFMKNITKILRKNVTQEATTTKKIKACFCPVTNYQKNCSCHHYLNCSAYSFQLNENI